MSEREQIELEIQHVLTTETQAIGLSNKLFRPDGLFSKLCITEQERRTVAKGTLFQEAQRRLAVLQRREAAVFAEAVRQANGSLPEGSYLFKVEGAQNSANPGS